MTHLPCPLVPPACARSGRWSATAIPGRWTAVLLLALAGCGEGGAAPDDAATTPAPDAGSDGGDAGPGRRALAFAAPTDHPAGMPRSRAGFPVGQPLAAADFDGDGAIDVAVPSTEGVAIAVLFGDGHGGFDPPLRIPTKGRPTSVTTGDFDEDGRVDLVAGYDGTSVSFLRARAGKLFDPPVDLRWPDQALVVQSGDFDGDHHLDVATGGKGGAAITIGAGDGHGGFTARAAYPIAFDVIFLAAGDLDGDGRDDLVLPEPWQLCDVLLSRPGGALTRTQQYQVDSATIDAPAIADLDGDGHLDVVIVEGNTDARVLRGDGTGQLVAGPPLSLQNHGDATAVADFDGDGHLDVAIAADALDAVVVLLGDGRGGLAPGVTLPTAGLALGLVAADLDGDHLPDLIAAQDLIAISGPTGSVRVFRNASR